MSAVLASASDLLAGAAEVLMQGPLLLLLLGLAAGCVLVGFGYGWGRRAAFREVDAGRAVVWAACERAAAVRVVVPGQREPS